MFPKRHFWILILAAIFTAEFYSAVAQTPRSYLWEAEFEVKLPQQGKWNFFFGTGNRYLFLSEVDGAKINEWEQQHIELTHFTQYYSGKNAAVGLGLRYRFREIFSEDLRDEVRIYQQFDYTHTGSFLTPAHRLRFEQRFREETTYRLRYELGISQPIGKSFDLRISSEFLYSMLKDQKPEMEQRITLELENYTFKNLELNLGLEMRREDLTGLPGTEFFLVTGASLQL